MATKKSSTNPTRVAAKSPAKPAPKSPAKSPAKPAPKSPAKSASKSPAKSVKKTVDAPASKAIKVVQGVKPSVLNGHAKTTPTKSTRTPAKALLKTPSKPQLISPHGLVKGKHIVCFWKQNDLGLFGRRPDRWIQLWEQDPKIEKVLVFETPLSKQALEEWLKRAITLDPASGSEYRLLLDQAVAKLQGKCDTAKTTYKSFLTPIDKAADNQDYLRWVLQQIKTQGIESPTVVLWPACFANEAVVKAMNPQQIITDLIDDQRLFPANASLVPTITSQYRTWLKLSDTVVSNSEGLIGSFVKEFARQDISLLPNQALTPQPVTTQKAKPRAGKSTKKRMVVGFVGNMRERMDTPALLQAMADNPDKDFWFVGQTHGSTFYTAASKQPNCKFWGTLRQAEAEEVVAQFDVAVVPFLNTPLVASMSPMKQETYAKGKVPTVTLGELKNL